MKKIVLITGCSSGLGKFLAEYFAQNGYGVYAGMRSKEDLTELGKIWKEQKLSITPIELDITNNESCIIAVKQILEKDKYIDILINNAGNTLAGPTLEFSVEEFSKLLSTNVLGAFQLTKSVTAHMDPKKGGYVINITSLNGHISLPNFGLYSSSKFALEALGLALHYELKNQNIHLTNISPGAMKNPENPSVKKLPHKPARDRFLILKILMPFVTFERVAEVIFKSVQHKSPPSQITIGADAKITTFLHRILPAKMWDALIQFIWKK